MNCQACRNEIEELELGERLSVEASAHLVACSPCEAFYRERLSLRKLVGSLEPVSAPPDFEFRLRARLAASHQNGNHRHSFWRSLVTSTPALGFAATFALLVIGVVLYNQFKPAPVAQNKSGGTIQQNSVPKNETPNTNSTSPIVASTGSTNNAALSDQQKTPLPTTPAVVNKINSRLVANGKGVARRQSRQPDFGNEPIVSNAMASRGAPLITPGNAAQLNAESNHFVELPVRSSAKPVRVFVDDKIGGKRTVTLEPVVLGSQDVTGRNDTRQVTSQGIW
jgi:hypothetical protein